MNCLPIISISFGVLDIVRLCGLIRNNDDDDVDFCYKYDLHCYMASPFIKSCVKCTYIECLRSERLV